MSSGTKQQNNGDILVRMLFVLSSISSRGQMLYITHARDRGGKRKYVPYLKGEEGWGVLYEGGVYESMRVGCCMNEEWWKESSPVYNSYNTLV